MKSLKRPGLSEKQKAFCREYMKTKNATQSAKTVGYTIKSAHVTGPRLLDNAGVQEYITKLSQKAEEKALVSVAWVIEKLKKSAEINSAEYQAELMNGNTIVKQVEATAANKSLELIGRHLEMFTDKVKVGIYDDLAERLLRAEQREDRAEQRENETNK
jgi:phage terminase small subunit